MKKRLYFTLLVTVIFLGTVSAEAANRYVRADATGANSGIDWENAYTSLPISLVRGDTYYIADGTYPSQTFNTANAGTQLITIKKATVSDHGTATGWVDTYGNGQATFDKWNVYTDYWIFDGQTRNANWLTGAVSQYGFHVHASSGALRLDDGNGAGADNTMFRYIDFEAGGNGTGKGDDTVYGLVGSVNLTFHKCALRDSDRTIFLMRGQWQNLLVEYSYLARNTSTPAVHGEMLSDVGSDNLTFRYNMIEDIQGTGVWAVLNGASGAKTASNTALDWKIYGNIINWTASATKNVSALFYSANDASNNNYTDNLVFYNNTIYGSSPRVANYGVFIQSGSNNLVKNNIFYNAGVSSHVNTTADYNWYYLTTHTGEAGVNTQTCALNCTIFTNTANNDFSLSGTNLPDAGDSSIGSEFNTDMNGVIRGADGTWNRGAFEFARRQHHIAPAPSGLRIQ